MNILVENSVLLTLDSQADKSDASDSSPKRHGAEAVVPCTSPKYTPGIPVSRLRSPPTISPKASSTATSTPVNIVTRLQQLHGLTRKKLYGSANYPPPRAPFFADKRSDQDSHRAPAQPCIPLDVEEYINHNYLLSNSGGKVQMRVKERRKNRLMQCNTTSFQPVRRGKELSSTHIIGPLAASYNIPTTFGTSTHLPVTTPRSFMNKISVDTTTATISSASVARYSWNSGEQRISQDLHHPQSPCQWDSYTNSHAQENYINYQGGLSREGNDSPRNMGTYLPIAPSYLPLNPSNTGVHFGESSVTLQENRLNRSIVNATVVSVVMMNEGVSAPINTEEVVPQIPEDFSYGPSSRLESDSLPQFHHTSSSSLPAMTNHIRHSPWEDRAG